MSRPQLLSLAGLLAATTLAVADEPHIQVNGVDSNTAEAISQSLPIAREACDTLERRLQHQVSGARNEAIRLLKGIGYYHSEVTPRLEYGESCWVLYLDIEPGRPTLISEVNVRVEGEGSDDEQFRQFLKNLPVKPGDRLNHGHYEAMKSRLGNIAASRGFIDAHLVRHRMVVDVDQYTAHIELLYDTGPRYRFGEFTFEQDILDESLLRRYSDHRPGDPFDVGGLIELNQRLSGSGYYSMVQVRQQRPDRDSLTIPVLVTMEPRLRYGYSLKGGFSTDTGPRGGIAGEARRVNRAGHSINAELEVSPVISTVGVSYRIPGAKPHTDYTRFSLGFKTEDTDTFDSDIWQLEASRVAVLRSGWKRTVSLRFQEEQFRIDQNPRQRTMLLLPGIDFSRTRADDLLRPRSGWTLTAGTRGAVENILSDTSLVQLHLRGKYIMPLGRGRLLTRAETGATWVENFSVLPASLRFYTGGDNSVRGSDYEELGPTDSDGNVVGGRYMIAASAEYEWPIREQFGIAAFYDVGNAFNTLDVGLQSSVGMGIRWHSPIGPIRVDLATPLEGSGFRIHLSMGPDL